jgi:uncharacterized protein (DUF3084 family)
LAQAEAEIERLRTAATTTNEAAEKATTATGTTEAAARDTAQIAAQEKAALETKVADLEQDLVAFRADLSTANRQFNEVTNRLQEVSEENNSKLSQDLDGESQCFHS